MQNGLGSFTTTICLCIAISVRQLFSICSHTDPSRSQPNAKLHELPAKQSWLARHSSTDYDNLRLCSSRTFWMSIWPHHSAACTASLISRPWQEWVQTMCLVSTMSKNACFVLFLTLSIAEVSTVIQPPGLTYIFNFWHLGTLALNQANLDSDKCGERVRLQKL